MGWVRGHRRFGACLALTALALQLVLSFGHVHLHGTRGVASHQVAAGTHEAAPAQASRQNVPQNTSDDDDYCVICASIYLVSTSFVSAPPALPVPVGFERIEHSFVDARAVIAPRLVAFQSRAPPTA